MIWIGHLPLPVACANPGVQREVTLNDATAASNYGQLLEACDRCWAKDVFLGNISELLSEFVGYMMMHGNLWKLGGN